MMHCSSGCFNLNLIKRPTGESNELQKVKTKVEVQDRYICSG